MSGSRSGSGAGNYVLMNAKISQGSSTSGIGSVSAFQLRGLSDSEMKKHVGHQVQVTGRLSAGMSGSTTGMSGSGSTGSGSMGSGSTGTTGTTGSGTTASGTTGSGTTGSGTTGSGTTGSGTTGSGTTGSGSSASGMSGQRSGSGMNGMNMSDMPQIQASNIKMISATCPAQ